MPLATTVPDPGATHASTDDRSARWARRGERYAALRTLWALSSLDRVRSCKHHGILPSGSVAIKATGSGADRRAGFEGLATCGSTWACPVCSHKISAGRADDIAAAITQWLSDDPANRIALATFTQRHHKWMSLKQCWDGLGTAWGNVTSGRGWVTDQQVYGTYLPRTIKTGRRKGEVDWSHRIPFIRQVEATHGDNGWHLHIHAVLFLGPGATGEPMNDQDCDLLEQSMFARWHNALVRAGLPAPSRTHGADIRLVTDDPGKALGEYLTKGRYGLDPAKAAAMETTMGMHKQGRDGNRTPFEVLRSIVVDGLVDDLDTWREWEQGSFRRRQITWSTGFREYLELGEEATDEELAEAALDGDTVVELDAAQYAAVRECAPELLDLAEVDDDGRKLCRFLRTLLGGAVTRSLSVRSNE